MTLEGKNVGFALTGSFCTYEDVFKEMENLIKEGAKVYPIFSDRAKKIDSRFGKAKDFLKKAKELTGIDPVTTIADAEPFGPKGFLDIVIVAPCTGNTLAKLANGITDSPVLMAVKGHLRNVKPVVLAIATNDALGANLKNIGLLMNTKNFYFVPFGQDNYQKKPNSMVAHYDLILPTAREALEGRQIQPVTKAPR
ncbi:MAG TPA: dipicolinate synthase subunit B [Lachnospiraceae bacterium]|jgi:dipicolinate synthase subunit B|nr:dipicolinate synthase subunit B [Lachnospiraceae bacterium]HBY71923.1 dipicolinate synthase subunit B [Lachnospiraceae bacterium]HCA69836.1 dipicolinate synthase subunit B [Lachnospiraceae bacterium]HCM13556.1 dipicolinate synthase subunit B [Lachnospiraceae bacterium]HCR40677.1 dipicolinate synthase subunit B [Lachnospiraceae bacterium]